MDLKLWLKERELNARQIASRKTIADRSVWIEDANYFNAAYDAIQRAELQGQKPIDMVLHCPACGMQHVDAPDERTPGWVNEPHRSHLCHDCGHVWRPSDVPTNGVAAVKTKGKADSPVAQAPNAQQAEAQEPVLFVSPEQLSAHKDIDEGEFGSYLPARKTAAGKFTQPLFTRPQPAQLQALSEEDLKEIFYASGFDIRYADYVQSALAAKNGVVLK